MVKNNNLFKVLVLSLVLIIGANHIYGQNVGIGTSSPNAKLDIDATNSGILIPRIALTGTTTAAPVISPVVSMLIYNSATAGSGITAVTPGFYYWTGAAWNRVIDYSSVAGLTVAGDVTGSLSAVTVTGIQGKPISLATGILKYNGSAWIFDNTAYLAAALGSGNIFVGNGANIATGVTMSGDATINNAGVISLTTNSNNYIKNQNAADQTADFRITGKGLFSAAGSQLTIGTVTPNAANGGYQLTMTPNSTNSSGINMSMTGASSTSFGLNITAASSSVNGILMTHSSTGNGLYGIGSVLSSTAVVSGYLGYRTGGGNTYGVFGINGTTASYATASNTWAGFFQGRTVISSESAPTSAVGTDLEVRNTTTGGAAPATLSLRQTTSVTAAATSMAFLNFGDNYQTGPQAQIQVLREAASSSATDLPTALTFSTVADGTSTLTERMRIMNSGNVGVGTTNPARTFQVKTATSTFGYSHTDGTIEVSSYIGGSITGGWMGTVSNHPFALYTNNSGAQVYLATSGNLSVGGTSPSSLFNVGASNQFQVNSTGAIAAATGITSSGTITFSGLSGTGNRTIYANSGGVLTVSASAASSNGNKIIYDYSGSNQYFVVPTGVYTLNIELWGAGGGGGYNTGDVGSGGGGGYVSGTLNVTPGEVITMIVGGGGCTQCSSNAFGGGGAGSTSSQGGAGGGRTAIRRGSTELATAGGGGGGSREAANDYGGGGGGSSPINNYRSNSHGGNGGVGGTTCSGGVAGGAGSSFQGGNAGCCTGSGSGYAYGGGGGGGGYIGGGGGAQVGSSSCYGQAGGGGGSSYTGGLATVTNNLQGTQGNGDGTTYYAANNAGLPSGYVNARGYGAPKGSAGGNGLITLSW